MTTAMNLNKREKLLQWLVDNTTNFYLTVFKSHKSKWKNSKEDLRSFPTGSLGKEIANFLDERNIDLFPKAESHDVYHIMTGYETTSSHEVAMQFWLLGNGKIGLYSMAACVVGFILIPEYWRSYYKAYKKGKNSPSIVNWDFEEMLYSNASLIKEYIHHSSPVFIPKTF